MCAFDEAAQGWWVPPEVSSDSFYLFLGGAVWGNDWWGLEHDGLGGSQVDGWATS